MFDGAESEFWLFAPRIRHVAVYFRRPGAAWSPKVRNSLVFQAQSRKKKFSHRVGRRRRQDLVEKQNVVQNLE